MEKGVYDTQMKNDLLTILKGFIIGSSMSVPGVSGGTMAILLGIYDKLISSVSNFLKDIKGNIIFFLKFCLGAGLGILALVYIIDEALERFPLPVSFFFLGAVIGGIPALYKKTKESPIRVSSVIYFLLGLGIVISIGFLPTGSISFSTGSGLGHYLMVLVAGIIVALALVLPGISTSHMLLVLGMYETTILAVKQFDIVYIGLLGISTVVGIFLVTKPIEWTMNKFTHQTYCVIIGFVLGSTTAVFNELIIPKIQPDAGLGWWVSSIVMSVATFILGLIAILSLSKYSND